MDRLNMVVLWMVCMVEIYIFFDYFDHYFMRKERFSGWLQRLSISVGAIILLFFINMLGSSLINLLMVPVLLWAYMSLLFDSKMRERLVCLLVAWLLFMGCEFLYPMLAEAPVLLSGGGLVDLKEVPWQVFGAKLLTYLIFAILKQFTGSSKNRMSDKVFVAYLFVPITSIGVMIATYYSGTGHAQSMVMNVFVTLCFFFMMAGNMILFYAFTKYSEELYRGLENAMIIDKYKADLLHLEQMQRVDERHDMFWHDIDEKLRTLDEMALQGSRNEILCVVSGLHEELARIESEIYSTNSVLNAILVGKRRMAEERDIIFDAYAEPSVKVNQIEDVDLIAMLGNLLDNAIRATEQCSLDRKVWVRIFMENEGRLLIFKIINPFNEKIIKNDDKFVSTKQGRGRHGIGLRSVERAVENYDGFLKCTAEENEFTALVLLSVD